MGYKAHGVLSNKADKNWELELSSPVPVLLSLVAGAKPKDQSFQKVPASVCVCVYVCINVYECCHNFPDKVLEYWAVLFPSVRGAQKAKGGKIKFLSEDSNSWA